jgi:indole-3-glycerol phosphate synthase
VTDTLAQICKDKRAHVAKRKHAHPLSDIERLARQASPPRGFAAALRQAAEDGRYPLVAEIKRASPSKGVIREDFDVTALARAYARGGAVCLSVLTDEPYFEGRDAHLPEARAAVMLPALRKDFMLDPYQVVEARALGADAILVIMAAVDDGLAAELVAAARDWNMDALIEVHDRAELGRALALESGLIGINNRNLKTLTVDLATTEELAPLVPQDRLTVAESGIFAAADLARLWRAGARAFLVGESLMRQADVTAAVRALIGERRPALLGA